MKTNEIRAEKITKAKYAHLTRAQIEDAFEQGWIRNTQGKILKKGQKDLAETDFDFSLLEAQIGKYRQNFSSELTVGVIETESSFWVLDKPAGMASQSLRLSDKNTLTQWALTRDSDIAHRFKQIIPEIAPHRLDTGTSGIQIIARTPQAMDLWRARFSGKEVEKVYFAWCWGEPKRTVYEISYAIGHDLSNSGKMAIPALGEKYRGPVQSAQTVARIIKHENGISLVRVSCFSGVTHQVRVHLAAVGLPLVGDETYDANFGQRPKLAGTHLLRAAKLICRDVTYSADMQSFEISPKA